MNILKILAESYGPSATKPTKGPEVDLTNNQTDLPSMITNIMNGVIAVLGFVCVVVMIVGGVNYMISAGDSNKVTKAKNTILYGLIGLVICVLAFAIVNFVIKSIIGGQDV